MSSLFKQSYIAQASILLKGHQFISTHDFSLHEYLLKMLHTFQGRAYNYIRKLGKAVYCYLVLNDGFLCIFKLCF